MKSYWEEILEQLEACKTNEERMVIVDKAIADHKTEPLPESQEQQSPEEILRYNIKQNNDWLTEKVAVQSMRDFQSKLPTPQKEQQEEKKTAEEILSERGFGEYLFVHRSIVVKFMEEYAEQSLSFQKDKLIKLQSEYIAFLNDGAAGPETLAYIHGFRHPENAIERGKEFRSKINKLKLELKIVE